MFSCRWSADDYDVKPFVSPCDSDHIIFFGEFEKWYHFKWNNLLLYCINPFSLPLNCLDGIWEFTFLSGAYNQEILTFGHSKPLALVHLCSWNKNADLPIIWSCMVWVDIYAIFICLSNYVTLAAGFIEDMQKKSTDRWKIILMHLSLKCWTFTSKRKIIILSFFPNAISRILNKSINLTPFLSRCRKYLN